MFLKSIFREKERGQYRAHHPRVSYNTSYGFREEVPSVAVALPSRR
jgi:hypothetical protein